MYSRDHTFISRRNKLVSLWGETVSKAPQGEYSLRRDHPTPQHEREKNIMCHCVSDRHTLFFIPVLLTSVKKLKCRFFFYCNHTIFNQIFSQLRHVAMAGLEAGYKTLPSVGLCGFQRISHMLPHEVAESQPVNFPFPASAPVTCCRPPLSAWHRLMSFSILG